MTEKSDDKNLNSLNITGQRPTTGLGPIERKTKYFVQMWAPEDRNQTIETSFFADHPNSIQKMGHRKFTHDLQAIYLTHLAKYGVQNKAALMAGVTPRIVQMAAKDDPDFAEAQKLAWEIWRSDAEERIVSEAIEGTFDRKWDKDGNLISERRVLEPRLRELILKRTNKEYVETQKSEVAVTGGAVVVPAPIDSVDTWEATVAKYTGRTVETTGQTVDDKKLPDAG